MRISLLHRSVSLSLTPNDAIVLRFQRLFSSAQQQQWRLRAAVRNGILVIGAPKVGKRFIVQKLVTPRAQTTTTAVNGYSSRLTLQHSGIEAFDCSIDTKYYSAQLTFHVIPAATHAQFNGEEDEEAAADAAAGDSARTAALSSEAKSEFAALDAQALMLIFNLGDSSSFHALAARWLPFIEERNPSVLLLVGNDIASTSASPLTRVQKQEREDLEQLARDWALDHGLSMSVCRTTIHWHLRARRSALLQLRRLLLPLTAVAMSWMLLPSQSVFLVCWRRWKATCGTIPP